MRTAFTAILLAATTLGGCATVPADAPMATSPAAVSPEATAALHSLFERTDAESLRRNPVSAFGRGDFSQADRLGDFSPAYFAAERAAAVSALAELRAIDRASLSELDRLAYDTFEYAQERTLAQTSPEILPTVLALPVDHFRGFHVFYPRLSAPGALMPFETPQDFANNAARHRDAAKVIDQSIARMRTGMASGITLPRMSVEIMIDQFDTILNAPPTANPFFAPIPAIPDSFTDAQKAAARAQTIESVTEVLFPAMRKMRAFLADEYLPAARPSIAATATPGGNAYYGYRIEEMTTLPLTANAIHETGLAEVARINQALAEARAEAGGDMGPTYTSKADLQQAWYAVGRKVDPLMDRLFLRQPQTPLQIEPYEPYREKYSLAASYMAGEIDGSRPGTFYFSGYNVAERQLGTSISLYMHEGNPGHHFQIMFARENEALPNFMRFDGYTAFSEGWGLYAESLGYEIGLYDDPVERAKYLGGGELLRAVRLVVDTGMHSKGWSRERAIEYMVANGQERDFAESETARYIVMPGQALAYKIGELKIKELRAEAEAALGNRFDVRRFHDQVLSSGNIPLPVLERKIDAWIAAGGR